MQPYHVSQHVFTKRCALAVLFVALPLAVFATRADTAEAPTEPLVIAGSGGNLALIKVLVEAYGKVRPEVKIDIPASIGSTGATRAAAEGAIGLGLISRPLKDNEQSLTTVLLYARTVIVIGAHPTVAEDNITSEDLVRIYKKAKTRWQDGRDIVVLTREPGDSTILVVEQVIAGFKEAYTESQQAKRWTTLYTDQEMNQTLAKTPYTIGFSDLGAITAERLPIKALKVNGVFPAEEHVRSGQYPLVRPLAFVFRQDKLSPEAKAFIDFTQSEAGAAILRANGYLPSE